MKLGEHILLLEATEIWRTKNVNMGLTLAGR
jgi:hypothetical protein